MIIFQLKRQRGTRDLHFGWSKSKDDLSYETLLHDVKPGYYSFGVLLRASTTFRLELTK